MPDTIENQLLYASLLCGMTPNGDPAYRLQLFFVANNDLDSKSHQADFQRALQTGVDKGLWGNYGEKGGGEYMLTSSGYDAAITLFGRVKSRFRPVRAHEFQCRIVGQVSQVQIKIQTYGKTTAVYIDGTLYRKATEACREIEAKTGLSLPTKGESAVRVLYNMAIDYGFQLYWEGPTLPVSKAAKVSDSGEPDSSALAEEAYFRESSKRRQIITRRHNKLSNEFVKWLNKSGFSNVVQEQNNVDVVFEKAGRHYRAEIKIGYGVGSTKAIREALGQLLEYNYYPGRRPADHWVIILDEQAATDDVSYLHELKEKLNLPLCLGWCEDKDFVFARDLGL
jgi:hypothetical protein